MAKSTIFKKVCISKETIVKWFSLKNISLLVLTTFSCFCSWLQRHSNDVKVWTPVWICLRLLHSWLFTFITFDRRARACQTSIERRGGGGACTGHSRPYTVVERSGHLHICGDVVLSQWAVSLAQHRSWGRRASRHGAGNWVILSMIYDRRDPPSKSWLFAVVGTSIGMSGFYLTRQLVSLILIHDEYRFKPFRKSCVCLNSIGIGSSL